MPGRLKRSTPTADFVRQPRVELFEITCLCGQTLSGQRLPRPQAVECPVCGEGLFVLPLDPYPAVVAHPRRRPGRHYAASGPQSGSRGSFLWSVLTGPVWPELAAGRLLLLAILATMTAGLSIAFWLDGQARPGQASRTASASPPRIADQAKSEAPTARAYHGRVLNGTVVIDGEADLPEGARLSIQVVPAHDEERADGTSRGR